MTKAFDPGNGKWYDNVGEHVTKKAKKGNLEDITKKLIREQMSNKKRRK